MDICVFEKIWRRFFSLLSATTLPTVTEIEVESGSSSTTTSSATTEELCEKIIHVDIHVGTSASTSITVPNTLCSLLVINSSFVVIRKHLVRVRNNLEFLLSSLRIILVLIWMVLDGKFLESLLNLIICSRLLHSQNFIVVFLFFFICRILLCLFFVCPLLPLSLLLSLVVLLVEALLESLSIDHAQS